MTTLNADALDVDFPLAFLILAHGSFGQLERLVRRLSPAGADTVVVHIDAKVPDDDFGRVRESLGRISPNVLFSERVRSDWGGFALVEAAGKLIDALERSGRSYRYASLLSGKDYPIKPVGALRSFLARHDRQEFIECFDFFLEPFFVRGIRSERVDYRWPFTVERFGAHVFKLWSMLQGLADVRRVPPRGMRLVAGSQWWTLSREALSEARRFMEDPQRDAFFRTTFVPDELVFSTALANSSLADRISGRNLRCITWLPSGTPRAFLPSDFARLAASDAFFARKVDATIAPDLIDKIDAELLV